MKKFYFATVCFIPPAMVVLIFAVFLGRLPFPVQALPFLDVYCVIGVILVLIDLWRSPKSVGRKIVWTLADTIFAVVGLPLYWFLVIVPEKANHSPEPTGDPAAH